MSLDCNHVVQNTMPNRNRRCRSASSGRLMTLLDLSPADFRRFLIVLVDASIGQPVLFEYGTDCEWHPSWLSRCHHDQMLPVVSRILASL